MPSYNKIILIGNLTRDPELKYLANQTPVAEFGLAVNHKYKSGGEQREDVCFIDCAAFGKQAETIQKFCTKGKAILVEGRLKLDSWDDKQTGQKRSKHRVVVDTFQFISGPPEASGSRRERPGNKPVEKPDLSEPAFKDEEIPF